MDSGIFTSSSSNSPEELDKFIQSFEFENQQHVNFIEKENQHIEELEKQVEEKNSSVVHLQESTTKLDEETKRAHKQFIQNRDNCDSLRKTATVLLDHEIAVTKKLNSVMVLGQQESNERQSVLQHYTNIWQDYKAKYETFPLAQILCEKQEHLQKSRAKLDEVNCKIEELAKAISNLQGDKVDFYDMKKFLVAVAEIKLNTLRNQANITAKWTDKRRLETKLEELKEKKRLEEEERVIQVQREEAEKKAQSDRRCLTEGTNHSIMPSLGDGSSLRGSGQLQPDVRNYITQDAQSTLSHMHEGNSPYGAQPQSTMTAQSQGHSQQRDAEVLTSYNLPQQQPLHTARTGHYVTAPISQPTVMGQSYASTQQPTNDGRQKPFSNMHPQLPQFTARTVNFLATSFSQPTIVGQAQEQVHTDGQTSFYTQQPQFRARTANYVTAPMPQPTTTTGQMYTPQLNTDERPASYNPQPQQPQYRDLLQYLPIHQGSTNVTTSTADVTRERMNPPSYLIQAPAASPRPSRMTTPSSHQGSTQVSRSQPQLSTTLSTRFQLSMPAQPGQRQVPPPAFKHPNILEPGSQRASSPKTTPRTVASPSSQQQPQQRVSQQFLSQSQLSSVYKQSINSQRQESAQSVTGRPASVVPGYIPQSPSVTTPAQRSPPAIPTSQVTQQEQSGQPVSSQQASTAGVPGTCGSSTSTSPHTPTRPARPASQANTPESAVANNSCSTPESGSTPVDNSNEISPFDLEKHLARVRLLTKSPGEPEYDSRPMFCESTTPASLSTQEAQNAEPLDNNPFMSSFFSGGKSDGEAFQSDFPAAGFGEHNPKSLFGKATSPDVQTEHQMGMAFDFGGGGGDAPQTSSMLSLFGSGAGGASVDNTGTEIDSGFSFNFGGSSPPPSSASSGFNLF